MPDYSRYSFWLKTSGDDLDPRPALDGSREVDVAILGAGFSGLWTAWYLQERDPSLSIAIIESQIAGFGASGRNGGWCVAGLPYPLEKLISRYGIDTARAVQQEMYTAVDEIGRIAGQLPIDAHYVKPGALRIARSPHLLPEIEQALETYRRLGLDDNYRILNSVETEERVRVQGALGSLWSRYGATVQPAALVRGLARDVERRGATIYEQTPVKAFTPGPQPRLHTDRGDVRARVIVLAGEAYLSRLPGLERQIIPLTSHMVITEPLPDELWEQIGWRDREPVTGGGVRGGYLQRTFDRRIAFGVFRTVYPFRSRISDDLDRQDSIHAHARGAARDWFPLLRLHGVRFTHAWGGVFGMPRDRMPVMSYDPGTGIASARGYTGEGVATSNLAGRVLADLITEQQSDLTLLPMANHRSPDWEPEPFRWLGTTLVRRSLQRLERDAERAGSYPEKSTLAQRIWRG